MNKVIVISGGAAGMMAAVQAAKGGCNVTILEKNEKLGKKVFITGKGRCNVTNACETEELFQNIVNNEKFLYSSIYQFDNMAAMQFFEQEGCPLKIERGNRVFPVSDHSSDVIRALTSLLKKYQVSIQLNTTVEEILIEGGEVIGVRTRDNKKIDANQVVLATGGASYPLTGSTGDGYRMAQKLGHSTTAIKPALIPFVIEENYCKDLMGLSLKNVQASIYLEQKLIYQDFGEMLFTHFGVSGPLILSGSSYLAKYWKGQKATLCLDLKPALTEEQLDKRLLRDFENYHNKLFRNALVDLFPSRLIPIMVELSGISPEKKVNEISKEERKLFVQRIKKWTLTISELRDIKEAIITQGGIKCKEINPSRMESKLVKNLFFAGEILDVDALTGGFNLQIAWSTGYLAGETIANSNGGHN